MGDVADRENRESELALLLMLMFSEQDMAFWVSSYRSPQWFLDRMQQLRYAGRLSSLSAESVRRVLAELRVDQSELDMAELEARLQLEVELAQFDAASRLSRSHQRWRERFGDERKRAAEARESAPPRQPRHEDIYPRWSADREAASSVTDINSISEIESVAQAELATGRRWEGIWIAERGACPVCEKLHQQPRAVWEKQFPRGPKAHPNCRCHIRWYEMIG